MGGVGAGVSAGLGAAVGLAVTATEPLAAGCAGEVGAGWGTAAGLGRGAIWALSGTTMGTSTATGRGGASNTMGNPTTAAATKIAAPSKRCRARRRKVSTLGGAAGSRLLPPNLNKAMGFRG